MFTSVRLTGVEYYLSGEDVEAAAKNATARDRAAYYVDSTDQGETAASWWAPEGNLVPDRQMSRLVDRGTEVDPRAFRALAAGCDPRTGEILVASNRTDRTERTVGYDCQMSAPKSVSALWACADIIGDTGRANEILDIQKDAMVAAMDWAHRQGLLIVRRGSGSKGTLRNVPVADVAAAAFLHKTSRSGDPQIHGHFVIASVACDGSGRYSGIDNAELIRYQGAMGAVFRAALAQGLQKRLGLAVEQKDRGFEIVGVPEDLTKVWSKRRQAIEAMAEAEGFDTAKNRARAQIAALATRDAKEKQPSREELKERWCRETAAAGWSPGHVWLMADAAGRQQRLERAEQGRASGDIRPVDEMAATEQAQAIARANEAARAAAAEAALSTLMQTQAVVESRHLYKEIGERLVGLGGIGDIEAAVGKLIADGKLVPIESEGDSLEAGDTGQAASEPWMAHSGGFSILPPDLQESARKSFSEWAKENPVPARRHGLEGYVSYTQDREAERGADGDDRGAEVLTGGRREPAFTTPSMIALEKSLIRCAVDRIGEGRLVSEAAVETAITRRTGILGDGQAATVLDTLTDGDISLSPERIGEAIKAAHLDVKQAAALRRMAADFLDKSGNEHPQTVAAVRDAMAPLKGMSDEQASFVKWCLGEDGVAIGSAPPGAGKSFSLGAVAEAARSEGVAVWTIAPSWKATSVVRGDTETAESMAKAVTGFVNRLEVPNHPESIELNSRSLIIIDEAGMVPTDSMEAILRHARAAGSRVILSGDVKQLTPVGAGSPMDLLERQIGSSKMTEIRRQKVEWMRTASTDFHIGRADRALESYSRAGLVEWAPDRTEAIASLVADWRADVEAHPDADPGKARIVMAYTNADLRDLNSAMRAEYLNMGKLEGPDFEVQAFRRGDGKLVPLSIARGDRLIFGERLNVRGKRIDNSDCATIESVHGDAADPFVRVRLDKGGVAEGKWSEFVGCREPDAPPSERHVKAQIGLAVSIHASQGSTVGKAFLLNTVGLKSQSILVGMTRHREWAKMYVDTAPVYDRLESRLAARPLVTQRGKKGIGTGDAPEAGEEDPLERTGKVTIEDVKAHVYRASMQSEDKKNVSDFVGDPTRWARGQELAAWEKPPVAATDSAAPQNVDALVIENREEVTSAARKAAVALHDGHSALPPGMPRGIVGSEADYRAAIKALDAVRHRQDVERAEATKAGLMRPFGQRWVPPRKPKEEIDVRTNTGGPGDRAPAVGKPGGKSVVDFVSNHAPCGTELAAAAYAGAAASGPPPAARGVLRSLSSVPVVRLAGRGEMLLQQNIRVRVDDLGAERDSAVRWPNHFGKGGSGQIEESRSEEAQGRGGRPGEGPGDGRKGTPEGHEGCRKSGSESGEGCMTTLPRPSPFAFRPFGRPLVPAAVAAADRGSRDNDVPAKKIGEPKIIRPVGFRAPHIRPPQQTAQDIRDRIQDRLQGTKYPLPDKVPEKVRVPEKHQWHRQTQEEARAELDRFGREVDLHELAKAHKWTEASDVRHLEVGADKKKSWVMTKSGQEIVVTGHGVTSTGNPGWWPVGGGKGEGGGCISFLQEAEGWGRGSLGRVRQELRVFLGEDPRRHQARAQAIQSDLQKVVDKKPTEKDYTQVRRAWQRLEQKSEYEYLTKRCITIETQRAFAADLRQGVDGYGRPFVAVPHRNDQGEIVGFEKKGAKQHPLDERSISMLEKGSDRGLTRMGQRENPTRIIVAEGFVDAMSKWQLLGGPKGACLCSMSGGPTDRSRRELADFVAKNPNAQVIICTDNDSSKYKVDYRAKTVVRQDPPGDLFAADIQQAIRAKTPGADIEISKAGEQFKDTNDELRGVTKADVEASYQEALRRCSSPDASKVDQQKAQERIDKDDEAETARMLWDALDTGRASPGQIRETVEAMAAAKNDREDRARAAADAKANGDEARRLALEEAQSAEMTVTRGGFHI